MTLQVAVIGIDGSGKSTLARALPMAVAAECGVVAGAAGDEFWVFGPDHDRLAPRFHPRGLPLAARIARACRALAKRFTGNPRLYPYLKLSNLMFQDDAAVAVGRRYACDVMVSDCNLVLSAMGRASNYRGGTRRERSTVADLAAVFELLLRGTRLPDPSARRLPPLDAANAVASFARGVGFDGVWLPDVVLFLDVDPEIALLRISERSRKRDRHENLVDMTHARETYLKAMAALAEFRPATCAQVIDANGLEPRDVLRRAVEIVRPLVERPHDADVEEILGTPRRGIGPAYVTRYLLPNLLSGAWREPLFLLSAMGRRLLREGYSAGVMRDIYDAEPADSNVAERAFLDYPLHRAVHDRLAILERTLRTELTWRLEQHERVRILTAPSGYCYDVFRPLETIASSRPELMQRVELIAADLDPRGELAPALAQRARDLGIDFHMLTGDLTASSTRRRLADFGPFDVALFVGLSSWLPRTETVGHLRWLADCLREDGLLVSDCFSAAPYSLGGLELGYRAHYYSPALYRCLLDYAGFDGASVEFESGRDRINHVALAEPAQGQPSVRQAAPLQSLASQRSISGESESDGRPFASTTV